MWLGSTNHAQGETSDRLPPLILTDGQGKDSLGPYLSILEDPGGELTIEEVASANYAGRFVASQEEAPNFGFTDAAVWLRFQLQNEAPDTPTRLLELSHPTISYVDLYVPQSDGSGFSASQTGLHRSFDTREMPHHNFVFELSPPQEQTTTYYLRAESDVTLSLPLTLWSPGAWAQKDQVEQFVWGGVYGIMLIMAGYNLFLFFSLREKSYIYLVGFILSLVLTYALADGRAHRYLVPNHGAWVQAMAPIVIASMLIFLLLFRARIPGN